MADKPIKKLFNKPYNASEFNDDSIGRVLNELSDYGVTELYANIAMHIGIKFNLIKKLFSLDTTSLSVQGEYGNIDSC